MRSQITKTGTTYESELTVKIAVISRYYSYVLTTNTVDLHTNTQ